MQELAHQYNAFCQRLSIPSEQRVKITTSTQQVVQYGAKVLPRQEEQYIEGIIMEEQHQVGQALGFGDLATKRSIKKIRFAAVKGANTLRTYVLGKSKKGMKRLVSSCFMEHECGLHRGEMKKAQLVHLAVRCMLFPHSKLWDVALPWMHVMTVILLPLPLLWHTISVQVVDRVTYAVEPEVDIFVWDDMNYLAVMDEVMLRKIFSSRQITKLVFCLVPVWFVVGMLALMCHITGLQAYNPNAFVMHSPLKHAVTLVFNLLCLFTAFIYTSCVGTAASWLLLGAILNPDQFLPYGVAVATCIAVASERLSKLKNMYETLLEKMQDCVSELLNEILLRPLEETILSSDDIANAQLSAVSQLRGLSGFNNIDTDVLLSKVDTGDIAGVTAQLAAQPLVASIGLSPEALKAILSGNLDDVEYHVSKALHVRSRQGRAIVRAIIASCPPWGSSSPPAGLMQAVEELAEDAKLPLPLSKALAGFVFATVHYKNGRTRMNAAMAELIKEILEVEKPAPGATSGHDKDTPPPPRLLRQMTGPEMLLAVLQLAQNDLRGLNKLVMQKWRGGGSTSLMRMLHWYGYGGADGKMEPIGMASLHEDLANFSETWLQIPGDAFVALANVATGAPSDLQLLSEHLHLPAPLIHACLQSCMAQKDQETLNEAIAGLVTILGNSAQHPLYGLSSMLSGEHQIREQVEMLRSRHNRAAATIWTACLMSGGSETAKSKIISNRTKVQLTMQDLQSVVVTFKSSRTRELLEISGLALSGTSSTTHLMPNIAMSMAIKRRNLHYFGLCVLLFADSERLRLNQESQSGWSGMASKLANKARVRRMWRTIKMLPGATAKQAQRLAVVSSFQIRSKVEKVRRNQVSASVELSADDASEKDTVDNSMVTPQEAPSEKELERILLQVFPSHEHQQLVLALAAIASGLATVTTLTTVATMLDINLEHLRLIVDLSTGNFLQLLGYSSSSKGSTALSSGPSDEAAFKALPAVQLVSFLRPERLKLLSNVTGCTNVEVVRIAQQAPTSMSGDDRSSLRQNVLVLDARLSPLGPACAPPDRASAPSAKPRSPD
ncbi:hypothetical protein CYMTET_41211 [Cymbomonas tetramitiformis]|uniref:Uncharacterized protein n=1 Tax=Cymbomonas tetramitiformis TaxID=36881 RepID=A0AAE0C8P9_9CHLO|nr:hypothetical protein CYMTET_41211 [Cymbomonas tetramitiformis]